jgi:hypothetical protein
MPRYLSLIKIIRIKMMKRRKMKILLLESSMSMKMRILRTSCIRFSNGIGCCESTSGYGRRAIGHNTTITRATSAHVVPIMVATASTGQTRWKTTLQHALLQRHKVLQLYFGLWKEDCSMLYKDQLVKQQASMIGELSHQFKMVSGQTDGMPCSIGG